MLQLQELREQIDKIDRQLATLTHTRFQLTDEIAKLAPNGEDGAYGPERVQSVLENAIAASPEDAHELRLLYIALLHLSRSRQYALKREAGQFGLEDLKFESPIQPGATRLSFAFTLHRSFNAMSGIFMLFCDRGFELLDIRLHPTSELEHLVCMDVSASPNDPHVAEVLYQLQNEMPSLRLLSWQ